MKTEIKELNLGELEQVSGGFVPFIIAGAACVFGAGYCIYLGVKAATN